jgi:hypothetical protein
MQPMVQPFAPQQQLGQITPQQQNSPEMQPPQPQLSPARQYLNAVQQYQQSGGQGPRPLYTDFSRPAVQPPQQVGGQQPMGQPMDRQREYGAGTSSRPENTNYRPLVQQGPSKQPYSPEMQAYRAQDAANQAQRGQMMQQRAMQAPTTQQLGQEDPRMQAMRYIQQMNFGG